MPSRSLARTRLIAGRSEWRSFGWTRRFLPAWGLIRALQQPGRFPCSRPLTGSRKRLDLSVSCQHPTPPHTHTLTTTRGWRGVGSTRSNDTKCSALTAEGWTLLAGSVVLSPPFLPPPFFLSSDFAPWTPQIPPPALQLCAARLSSQGGELASSQHSSFYDLFESKDLQFTLLHHCSS